MTCTFVHNMVRNQVSQESGMLKYVLYYFYFIFIYFIKKCLMGFKYKSISFRKCITWRGFQTSDLVGDRGQNGTEPVSYCMFCAGILGWQDYVCPKMPPGLFHFTMSWITERLALVMSLLQGRGIPMATTKTNVYFLLQTYSTQVCMNLHCNKPQKKLIDEFYVITPACVFCCYCFVSPSKPGLLLEGSFFRFFFLGQTSADQSVSVCLLQTNNRCY